MLVRISQRGACILIHFINTDPDPAQALDAAEFERQLRANAHAYHNYHAFNVLLNSGRASPEQLTMRSRRFRACASGAYWRRSSSREDSSRMPS